jgi:nifR3 family TIM-barrel protein
MKNLPLAGKIIQSVRQATPLPLTVKTRKGWDSGSVNCLELAHIAQECGANAISIHGRTRSAMYGGDCDWDIVAAVKRAVSIPVFCSGNIVSAETALRCRLHTHADGYLIGRATFGNPWVLNEIFCALTGAPIPKPATLSEKIQMARIQVEKSVLDKGEDIACREARKYVCWYLHGFRGAPEMRVRMMQTNSLHSITKLLSGISDC